MNNTQIVQKLTSLAERLDALEGRPASEGGNPITADMVLKLQDRVATLEDQVQELVKAFSPKCFKCLQVTSQRKRIFDGVQYRDVWCCPSCEGHVRAQA